MTQKYPDGNVVYSPGTVIISSVAEVSDIRKSISPVRYSRTLEALIYIDLSKSTYSLGGKQFCSNIK